MIQRKIESIITSRLHQGFLGEGHLAAAIIDGTNFAQTDPFILLMDDQLNLPGGEPVGGAHPHAGFETVTLVLEGDEAYWKTGSLERIFQLWLTLPPEKRWVEPSWQQILLENVPTYNSDKVEARVYSGSSNGLTSPVQNYTPFTLVDFMMGNETSVTQTIPTNYNGFIQVIQGEVWVGDTKVEQGQTAWFDKHEQSGESQIIFRTENSEARFILYAGQPHHVPVVNHGPFIGDTRDDIVRLYKEYNAGKMPHLKNLDASRKTNHVSVH